jgi:hypothetical protein
MQSTEPAAWKNVSVLLLLLLLLQIELEQCQQLQSRNAINTQEC